MGAPGGKKYYIFQEGSDIMFVMNVPPEELDTSIINSFRMEVESRGLDRIIFDDVVDIIKTAAQGEVVKIGGLQEQGSGAEGSVEDQPEPVEEKIDPETLPFIFNTSQDAMKSYLEIEPSANGTITRKHIEIGLEYSGIKYGIIEENLDRIVEEWPDANKVLIAEGKAPRNGRDAIIRQEIEIKEDLAPEMDEGGVVDFKSLNLISMVTSGDVLQSRIPPTPGEPGYDVFGKEIPPVPGEDLSLGAGQNTTISDDNTKLLADASGFISKGPKDELVIRPVYTVNGDVDYSTGNIKFNSDVIVKGDVRAGFSIDAGGDIHIYGTVEDAILTAGGNIQVNGGILSSGRTVINAGGDLVAAFLHNVVVETGGSCYIRIEALGSKVKAGKDFEVLRRDGRIVGGSLEVGGWVVTDIIGSENCPTLKVKFPGETDPNSKMPEFTYNFVSAKEMESAVRVFFGKTMMTIAGIEPPVTIRMSQGNIMLERKFTGQDELKRLRQKRSQQESGESSE